MEALASSPRAGLQYLMYPTKEIAANETSPSLTAAGLAGLMAREHVDRLGNGRAEPPFCRHGRPDRTTFTTKRSTLYERACAVRLLEGLYSRGWRPLRLGEAHLCCIPRIMLPTI